MDSVGFGVDMKSSYRSLDLFKIQKAGNIEKLGIHTLS